jgi:hypothetical protein
MPFRFQNVPDDEESKELANIMKEKSLNEVVQQLCVEGSRLGPPPHLVNW